MVQLPLFRGSTRRFVGSLLRVCGLRPPWPGQALPVCGPHYCITLFRLPTMTTAGLRVGPWPPFYCVGCSCVLLWMTTAPSYAGAIHPAGCNHMGPILSTVCWRSLHQLRVLLGTAPALRVVVGYLLMPGTICWCPARCSHPTCSRPHSHGWPWVGSLGLGIR